MTTEVLGFLIIVGALIVFVMRRDLWNGLPGKADDVEEASVKMRLQMEHSADEIIARMESRIRHLESLVTTADERARALENQLAAARADQDRAAMQAEQRMAAMRAAQDNYYMRGGAVDYMEPDARMAWQEGYYRPERRTMRPVDQVAPVRRMEPHPRMITPYDRGREDFAETLSASMRAEEARYPGEYARPLYAPPEPEPYYEPVYDEGYRGERVYDVPARMEVPQPAPRPAARRPMAPVLDAEELTPAERAVEETPAAVLESRFAPENRPTYEEEPENEPFFSEEALEELAHTSPEIVVSPSVADVVDLPIDPEEEEEELAHYEESQPTDEAYDSEPYQPEAQGARLHVAEGGEPLQAEPIYDAPSDAPLEAEPVPETGAPAAAEPEGEELSFASGPELRYDEEEGPGPEPEARPIIEAPLSQEPDAALSAEQDAYGTAEAPPSWESEPAFAPEPAEDAFAPRETSEPFGPEPGDAFAPGAADTEIAEQQPAEILPEAEAPAEGPPAEETQDLSFPQDNLAYETEASPIDGAETDADAAAEPYDEEAWSEPETEPPAAASAAISETEPYDLTPAAEEAVPPAEAEPDAPRAQQAADDAASVPEAAAEAETVPTEDEAEPTQQESTDDGAVDWLDSALTADAEAADMGLFDDEEPEDAASPEPRDESPSVRARELLAQGMTPTEVARETGMGRSAVELLAQMMGGAKNAG